MAQELGEQGVMAQRHLVSVRLQEVQGGAVQEARGGKGQEAGHFSWLS